MPFKSKAQKRFMYARHPEIAKRFQRETGDEQGLPERKGEKTYQRKRHKKRRRHRYERSPRG